MKYISIILLIISIILSLVIYYYINANIIEKFYELKPADFVKNDDHRNLYKLYDRNRAIYNRYNNYNNDTLEPKKININKIVDRCNKFEEKINGYGFL